MYTRRSPIFLILVVFLSFACSSQKSPPVELEGTHADNFVTISAGEAKQFYAWSTDRIPMVSAHRGGPYVGYPENSIRTFDYILKSTPAVIECDIEMTADSVLVMMHDNTLDRTTNGTGRVRDQIWGDLKMLQLKDNDGNITVDRIPTLEEVLNWSKGKALLTLDVKRGVPFQRVIDMVAATQSGDYAAIITYSARDAQRVYELDSNIMISVGIGNMDAYRAHQDLGIPDDNMIAFTGVSEAEPALYDFLHEKGIYTILGVLGNLDRKAIARGDSIYAGFVNRGADILATDRPIEAAKILKQLTPEESSKFKYFE